MVPVSDAQGGVEHVEQALPEVLAWMRPHLGELCESYGLLRIDFDPAAAFDRALFGVLDSASAKRAQAFFEATDAPGKRGARQRDRRRLRDAVEAAFGPAADLGADSGGSEVAPEVSRRRVGVVTDVERFYDQDPRRRSSEEVPFGKGWSIGRSLPNCDVYWIADTGELVALSLGGSVRDPLGDAIDRVLHGSSPTVEVLAIEPDISRLREVLHGWETAQNEPDSLAWLRRQLDITES
jgi:hypothetical protein